MVMRRTSENREPDDLPDRIRARFRVPKPTAEPLDPQPVAPPPSGWRDAARFALLFAAVAVGNMLFLLLSVAFLQGHQVFQPR